MIAVAELDEMDALSAHTAERGIPMSECDTHVGIAATAPPSPDLSR